MKNIIKLNRPTSLDYDLILKQKDKIISLSNRLKKLESLFKQEQASQKICFKTHDAFHYYFKKDIIYFTADGSYTCLFASTGEKLIISSPLKHIAEEMNDPNFVRVHQSYLINTSHIKKYIKKSNQIILKNNILIPVSRANRDILNHINL